MTVRRIALLAWVLTGAMILASIALHIAAGRPALPGQTRTQYLIALVFTTVGGVIAVRVPRHPIAWLFVAQGVAGALTNFLGAYSDYGLTYAPGSLPVATLAAWVGTWMWLPGLALAPVLGPYFFPNGRLPSRRWRPMLWTAMTSMLLLVLSYVPLRWRGSDEFDFPIENPLYVPALQPLVEPLVIASAFLLLIGASAGVASVGFRFRHSRGAERQQIKWVLLGLVVALTLYAGGDVITRIPFVTWEAVSAVAVLLLPVTVAMAIVRHQLWDIDRIISRTVAYAVLVALLGATYAGLVIGLGRLIQPLAAGTDIVVAGSTLVVAALFRPVMRRVQSAVDRRFNRARYDAARTMETFSARLREKIDIDDLTDDLQSDAL